MWSTIAVNDVFGQCGDEPTSWALRVTEVRDDRPGESPLIVAEVVHTGHCSACQAVRDLDVRVVQRDTV